MDDSYESYDHAADSLGVEKLSDRRSKLCLTFARRLEKHPKYSTWFHPSDELLPPTIKNRSDKTLAQTKYTPVPYRTDRFKKSPLPFLTELLNTHHARKKWNMMPAHLYVSTSDCKKWIIARKTSYRTMSQQTLVSNCVDLTHHFTWNKQLIIIYY